jgi:eukaryotic-like serine/threonine-protein kinase
LSHDDSATASLCSDGPAPAAGAAAPIFLPGEMAANRFRVVRLLGQGGMAQVFQAEDLELGQGVAIKVIRPELAASRRAGELLRREVLLARRITHPNVCRIFDVFHHRSAPAADPRLRGEDGREAVPPSVLLLVMELLRGETLARRLAAGGPLTAVEALPIVRQLAEALDAAHRAQVVHGDFKSSNVIVERTWRGPRAVVTDFGLSQHASMTAAACAGGTTAYMAPEQRMQRQVTPASDIYALGIVIFEMVCGRRPLAAEMGAAIAMPSAPRLAPAAPPRRPGLPAGWEAILARCLAPAAGDRPASAGEVAAALAESLARRPAPAARPAQRGRAIGWARTLARCALALGCLCLVAPGRAGVEGAVGAPAAAESAVRAAAGPSDPGAAGGAEGAAADLDATARQVVAVADLVDGSTPPAESWLRAALGHSIATEIAAGGSGRVEVLRAAAPGPGADRRPPPGTELLVSGSFAAAGEADAQRLRIDLTLVRAATGARLATFHQAASRADAADLISRLGFRLRRAIGIADPQPEERAAMLASRPATLAAEGLLADGLAQLERGQAVEARGVLGRALAADRSFPLTHAALARASVELGDGRRAREEAAYAARQPQRLPEQLRLEIAAVAKQANNDLAGAEGMLRALWRLAPHHPDYGVQLAEAQLAAGEAAAALETVRRLAGSGLGDEMAARTALVAAQARSMQGDVRASLAAALAAAGQARRTGAASLLAAARLAEADARAEGGDAVQADAALAEARDIYRRLGFRAGEAEVLCRRAALVVRAGQPRQAVTLDEEALAIFDAAGCARGSAVADMAIGRYWHTQHALPRARAMLERALSAFRSLGDRADEAQALNALSFVAFDSGDFIKAEKLLEDEVGVDSGIGDRKGLSRALINLGDFECLHGDFHASGRHVEEALRLAQALGDKTQEAFAHENLAVVLFAERDLHGAGVEAWRSASVARQANFPYLQRGALQVLSAVLLEERRFQPAENVLGQALALGGEHGDPIYETVLISLARLELWQGRIAEGERAVRQAQAMMPAMEPPVEPLAVLAWALAARGDLVAARAAAERAARLLSKATNNDDRLLVAIGRARVALAGNDAAAAAQGLEAALRQTALSPRPDLRYEARLLRDAALLAGGGGRAEAGVASGASAGAADDLRELAQEARRLRFELIAREAERQLAAAAAASGRSAANHG